MCSSYIADFLRLCSTFAGQTHAETDYKYGGTNDAVKETNISTFDGTGSAKSTIMKC